MTGWGLIFNFYIIAALIFAALICAGVIRTKGKDLPGGFAVSAAALAGVLTVVLGAIYFFTH